MKSPSLKPIIVNLKDMQLFVDRGDHFIGERVIEMRRFVPIVDEFHRLKQKNETRSRARVG